MTIPNKKELQAIREVRKNYTKLLAYVRKTPVAKLPTMPGNYFWLPNLYVRAQVPSMCPLCWARCDGCASCILNRNNQRCLAEGSLFGKLKAATTKKDLIKAIIAIRDYKIQYKSWR